MWRLGSVPAAASNVPSSDRIGCATDLSHPVSQANAWGGPSNCSQNESHNARIGSGPAGPDADVPDPALTAAAPTRETLAAGEDAEDGERTGDGAVVDADVTTAGELEADVDPEAEA